MNKYVDQLKEKVGNSVDQLLTKEQRAGVFKKYRSFIILLGITVVLAIVSVFVRMIESPQIQYEPSQTQVELLSAVVHVQEARGILRDMPHHMPWSFYVYSEPDFRAQPIMRQSPGTVEIRYETPDGWALIATPDGEYWAYLPENLRFIPTTGLFLGRGDTEVRGHMPGQVVQVLEEDGRWIRIEIEQGGRWWVDRNFVPQTYELEELLARHGQRISVYFENLETGFVFEHNADYVHFGASISKAPYAMYIYKRAEAGLADLDRYVTFTWADWWGGSGVIHHGYQLGASFTVRELLRLNLSESDNNATLMLQRIHGLEGYRNFIREIGGSPNQIGNPVMNTNMTVSEAGLIARVIFDYLESDSIYSQEFRAALLDNQFPFIVSDYPIASKTGWTAPHAWHDMAIVYAPSPFILVIFSQRSGWTDADYEDFAEISMAFQQFNNMWFVNEA